MVDDWDYMDGLDFENDPCGFDLRNDHGRCGWYDSGGRDDKCILDEGIVDFLVTLGYVAPSTRKTEAFFMMYMSDPVIQDLPFKERVVLVYENFCFDDDDEAYGDY